MPSSLTTCTVTGILISNCNENSNIITIIVNEAISKSTNIQINIGNVYNPPTTKPTAIFSINTYNNLN